MTWGVVIGILGVTVLNIYGVLPELENTGMSSALRAGVYYGSGIAVGLIAVEVFHRLKNR